MPTNNILLFDQNKGNMMGDTEYNTNQQRLNGVQSGIASSQLQNKFQYQTSLVAYAIASLMYNNGLDANDASAVSAFVSNLSSTLVQKVLDKASTAEARAGTVNTKWMSPALVKAAIDFTSVKLSGSTMTGPLILSGNPTANLGAATKQYVDNAVGGLIKRIASGTVAAVGKVTLPENLSNYDILLFNFSSNYEEQRNTQYFVKSVDNDFFSFVAYRHPVSNGAILSKINSDRYAVGVYYKMGDSVGLHPIVRMNNTITFSAEFNAFPQQVTYTIYGMKAS